MEQKEILRFRIIGACTETQTISWEDEISLIGGIPYDIDFFQDFSTARIGEYSFDAIPISSIIETITSPQNEAADSFIPSAEDYRHSQEFWEGFDKHCEKERKREAKWKKRKEKPRNIKEAERNFERIVDELLAR